MLFRSMANNYKEAVFLTEALQREINILNADGYLDGYVSFMEGLLVRHRSLLEEAMAVDCHLHREAGQGELRCEESIETDISSTSPLVGSGFVYNSPSMARVEKELHKAARYDCPILLCGETGTGKERALDIIHRHSPRGSFPCLRINCSAIPGELMEAELFGYEGGAYTGAKGKGQEGLFSAADRGILFLDEITELAPQLQAKLLRVLQEHEFFKVGGTKPQRVNVRVVSATNRDIFKMAREGHFREDLLYRLNVLCIEIPPLRERPEDIPHLAAYFAAKYGEAYKLNRYFSSDGLLALREHPWPGNVRELENFVQRLLINGNVPCIDWPQVMRELHRSAGLAWSGDEASDAKRSRGDTLSAAVHRVEGELIKQALAEHGSTRAAAQALGISQTQLIRKKKKYAYLL